MTNSYSNNGVVSGKSADLRKAAKEGNIERVKQLLLEEGIHVNARDRRTRSSALHTAAYFGHENIVQLLLSRHANANATDCFGRTPLHLAIQEGHAGVVRMLLDYGSDPNKKSDNGCAALHYSNSEPRITSLLLKRGANINERTDCGNTALHYVCYNNGNPDVVRVLLDYNINIHAKNRDGETAIECTEEKQITDIFYKHIQNEIKQCADIRAVVGPFCSKLATEENDNRDIHCKVTEVIPLINNVHEGLIMYMFLTSAQRGMSCDENTKRGYIHQMLQTTAKTTSSADSVSILKIIIKKAWQDGFIDDRTRRSLDRDADVAHSNVHCKLETIMNQSDSIESRLDTAHFLYHQVEWTTSAHNSSF